MDQLHVDIVFLSETFLGIEKKEDDSIIHTSTKGGYALFEYRNYNSRRGIQFRVSKDLEGIIMKDFCRKSSVLEVISLRVGEVIIMGAYVPDGYNSEGVEALLELIEALEAEGEDVLLLGDWNTKAVALGNVSTNPAGTILDEWLTAQDYTLFIAPEPTFQSRSIRSYIDVAMWKGPRLEETTGTILHSVRSDHKGLLLYSKWKETKTVLRRPRYNIKKVSKLLHQRKSQGGQWSALEVDEVLSGYLENQKPTQIRKRSKKYFFRKSQELKQLERKAYKAQRTGNPAFHVLRAAANQLWRKEKRSSFKKDLDDIIASKNVRKYCRFLRSTSPKETWVVNTGEGREEAIASTLTLVQQERPETVAFILEEERNLFSLDIPVKNLVNLEDVLIQIKRLKRRKSPGPSGLSYDHLKALDEETITILVEAMNNSLCGGSLPPNWFKLLIRPLSKRPGASETRPISLMESLLKLLDKSFNQHLLQLVDQHDLISTKQFGFTKGRSSVDQLVRMIDAIKLRKRRAVLFSVDLKGAYDRVDNVQLYERLKELIEPGWRNYLFNLLFKRKFRVTSMNSTHEQWFDLREGIPQGLPSGPTLFNIFIDPCLRLIDANVDDSFPFADDNSLLIVQKEREKNKSFLQRVSAIIRKITLIYRGPKALLSQTKSALLAFGFRPSVESIEGVKFKPAHKLLGITTEKGLYFNKDVEVLVLQLRKYLQWLKRYRQQITERQKRTTYCMFIQSQMDYHLIPIWHLLSKSSQLKLTRIAFQGARIILNAPTSIDGHISCREARILPPELRYQFLILNRERTLRALPNLAHRSYEKRLDLLEFKDETREEFLSKSDQILWERYHLRNPSRALTLQNSPPKKLSHVSRTAFLLRTEQAKTKDWRIRHAQPYLDQLPNDRLCRYCSQEIEEIHHLLEDCLHRIPARARKPLLALHQSMEANEPTIWSSRWALTRRENCTENASIEQELATWTETVLPAHTRHLNLSPEGAPPEPPYPEIDPRQLGPGPLTYGVGVSSGLSPSLSAVIEVAPAACPRVQAPGHSLMVELPTVAAREEAARGPESDPATGGGPPAPPRLTQQS
jgi:hypothetical protein